MTVSYGSTDISNLEKEFKKLGSFCIPSAREINTMELLHEDYRRTGENIGKRATEIFKLLNIPNGQDVGTLNDSRYLEKGLDGAHQIFKLSSDGIRYADYFYGLMLQRYEGLEGSMKNGYMENADKRSRARQWAKDRMREIVNGIAQIPVVRQNISGVFFKVGGDMRNDGTILTDKNAIVDINVRGNYKSKKGKIIQGATRIGQNMSIFKKYRDEIIIGIIVVVVGILVEAYLQGY